MHFTKMQGLGNDYVYINGFEVDVPDPCALARAVSRPHFGCGSDGMILILPGEKADIRMRMFNADGSESGMCGNGVRCVARYCYDHGLVRGKRFTVESGGDVRTLEILTDLEGAVNAVKVDMLAPVLEGRLIPSKADGCPVTGCRLKALDTEFAFTLISMGNPHAVCFVPDPLLAPVCTAGPILENDPFFPERANIEFVSVPSRDHLVMRVWERGSGETMACGTGACASLAAAVLNGLCERRARVTLPGGDLLVEWSEEDGHIYMTGPAEYVYEGEWPDPPAGS